MRSRRRRCLARAQRAGNVAAAAGGVRRAWAPGEAPTRGAAAAAPGPGWRRAQSGRGEGGAEGRGGPRDPRVRGGGSRAAFESQLPAVAARAREAPPLGVTCASAGTRARRRRHVESAQAPREGRGRVGGGEDLSRGCAGPAGTVRQQDGGASLGVLGNGTGAGGGTGDQPPVPGLGGLGPAPSHSPLPARPAPQPRESCRPAGSVAGARVPSCGPAVLRPTGAGRGGGWEPLHSVAGRLQPPLGSGGQG